jgi:hypothetical protein
VGDLERVFADRDEAAVRQRIQHAGHIRVPLQVELAEWSAAAHRRVTLPLADQAEHDRPDQLLAVVGDAVVHALRQPGDGAVYTARLPVGGHRQRVVAPLLPELEKGGRQQGQSARLALDVIDQRVDQLGLDPQPHPAGRQLDGPAKLRSLHRTDEHMVGAEQLRECRVTGEPPVVVGSQRDHHDRSSLRIGSRVGEGAGERGSLVVGATRREQLLQLVDC